MPIGGGGVLFFFSMSRWCDVDVVSPLDSPLTSPADGVLKVNAITDETVHVGAEYKHGRRAAARVTKGSRRHAQKRWGGQKGA